jgi:hypothetical protein
MKESAVEETEALPLECRYHKREWIINPVIMDASKALFAHESGYKLVSHIDPVVFCDHDECAERHGVVSVTYRLWSPILRLICEQRVETWNKDGRFRDSRPWIKGYMVLLVGLPWLNPLRGAFRVYAKSLVWPSYEPFVGPQSQKQENDMWIEAFQ